MLNIIIDLYVQGKNERQIKSELSLQGFKQSEINKSFNTFSNKFQNVSEVFNYKNQN